MAKPQYLVGHDVEMFVQSEGRIVPVTGRVGGTKEAPLPLEGSQVGTTYQEDGVALELGMAPCLVQEFTSRAAICYSEASMLARNKGLNIQQGSSFKFSKAALAPFPELLVLGCSPDQLASLRGMKRSPVTAVELGTTRCTGGHLHFSFPKGGTATDPRNENNVPVWAIVDLLDAFALSFYGYHSADCQGTRATYYGLPGLYRDKPYGVEYRTPSNTWFFSGDRVSDGFITTCSKVVQACNELSATKIHDVHSSIDMNRVRELLDLSVYKNLSDRQYTDITGTLSMLAEIKQDLFSELGELRS